MSVVAYHVLKWRAIAWLVLGRDAPALALFDQIVRDRPSDTYALSSRMNLYARRGQWARAVSDSDLIVATEPENAHHWFNRGYVLEQIGLLDEARLAFGRATSLSPTLDRAWYGLGLVLIRQHCFDEAVHALRRATELQPMSPHGWYQLARVHVDRHDLDAARKIIGHLKGFEPRVAAQLERETGLLENEPVAA